MEELVALHSFRAPLESVGGGHIILANGHDITTEEIYKQSLLHLRACEFGHRFPVAGIFYETGRNILRGRTGIFRPEESSRRKEGRKEGRGMKHCDLLTIHFSLFLCLSVSVLSSAALQRMPTLNISTNVPLDGVSTSDALKDLSKAVARTIGKPEQVMTMKNPPPLSLYVSVSTCFSFTIELKSIQV